MLVYTMDRPEDGGLDLESMGHYGDSGSGALMLVDGEHYIIGVKSNGGPAQYGTSHQYTRVGGYHKNWVSLNLASLDERIPAEGCDANGGDDEGGVYDECEDTNFNSAGQVIGDRDGDGCDLYAVNPNWCGGYDTAEFVSADMCCACGGGLRDEDEDDGEDDGEEDSEDDGDEGGDDGEIDPIYCDCSCD